MAKSVNQKLKLLYIMKILTECTDEEHAITTQELIDKLSAYDIQAERKTIYADIRSLCDFGYDIISSKQKNMSGYYLASKDFELAELKYLVDVIQTSKFITHKKSKELIKKLQGFCSKYEAKQLQRDVFVADRVKSQNENIFINVDAIHRAMQNNVQISFLYFDWNGKKEQIIRKDGARYEVSPWKLIFDAQNYYLLAYDEVAERMKHYRVDRMKAIEACKESRIGNEFMEEFNLAKFSNKTFGMFAGKEELVTLLFENRLASVAVDRFGTQCEFRMRDEEHFSIRVNVSVSGQFFGWIAGLSGGVKIMAPENVRREYEDYLEKIVSESKESI